MRSASVVALSCAFVVLSYGLAAAEYHVAFDFNTSWSTDYAPGWENTAYRHGEAPIGKMMEYVSGGYGGTGGMRLIADSVPQSWMWWAGVSASDVNEAAMAKQYDPWVSVRYYDETSAGVAGQLFAVPSWTNLYLEGREDWTDIQFGGRFNVTDNYYYVAAGQGSPGWQSSGQPRSGGWHQLKMQLSSRDGKVHFYLDGTEVGTSYRNDYVDLLGIGLYTMFQNPLSGWGSNKPSTIWDDFEFGSSAVVPAPGAIVLGMLGLGLVGWVKRRMA